MPIMSTLYLEAPFETASIVPWYPPVATLCPSFPSIFPTLSANEYSWSPSTHLDEPKTVICFTQQDYKQCNLYLCKMN